MIGHTSVTASYKNNDDITIRGPTGSIRIHQVYHEIILGDKIKSIRFYIFGILWL